MRLIKMPQHSGTYNLGSGVGYSINEVRGLIERVSQTSIKTIHHSTRAIDVRAIVMNTARIEAHLSWKPATGIESGVRKTWEWVSRQP